MQETRPSPDQLLARVSREEKRARRGRLKVFLGACAGVGKTFSMLEAAQQARRQETDIVIGYVESHGRAETDALLKGLESLPVRKIDYRGASLKEFDLDAALARKPAVIVLDELAHTNAPGSRHAKRWQDVQALLDAGISVFTTLNIQHIDSQNDLVAQITQVVVRETVPDSVIEEADDVELVDLPPDELLQRLREGKVYVPEMAERAQRSFFQKGNLIALRQLALRYTAERVDLQMRNYRRDQTPGSTWPVAERLLVCVGPSPQSPRVVRAAKRLADRLHAELIALYVETPRMASLRGPDRERVLQTLHLAEQLGAETATLTGAEMTDVVLRYARERNVSKIVIGKSTRRTPKDFFFGSAVDRMARLSEEVDIYVVKGVEEAEEARTERRYLPAEWGGHGWAVGVVGICTLLAWGLFALGIAETNLVMVYLAGVVFVGTRFGRGPSIVASILSVAAFDFFFVRPYLTFAVSDTQYLLTFGIMLIVAIVVSTLATQTRQQARSATARERRTSSLYTMSRELASTRGTEELVAVVRRHVEDLFRGQAVIYFPDAKGRLQGPADELGVAQWAFDHKQSAGLGTRTLPGSRSHNLLLQAANQTIGVLGFVPRDPESFLSPPSLELIETFASLAAVVFERERLARQASEGRVQVEAEKLRNTLLTSISHDLRTPLSAIKGAADLLLRSPEVVHGSRHDLLKGIHEEADYINRMVANVLELTRLESGAVAIKKEWQPVEEVVGAVTSLLENRLKDHPLEIKVPSDLPMVPIDASLIQQVIANLLENAIVHTPSGTPIELSARAQPGGIVVEVADRGPGLRPGEESKVFDKFYRATAEGKRTGMGLGLTLCDATVRLHGGRIEAENRQGGGALFRFTIPIEGVPPAPPPREDMAS